MKKISLILLGGGLLLAGCGTPDFHFMPWVGQQQNWATSPGGYVRIVDGVEIYSQYPSRPYEIVGAVAVEKEKDLAKAVKYYRADAAILSRQNIINEGSVVYPGPGVWVSQPITKKLITGQLIRFLPARR